MAGNLSSCRSLPHTHTRTHASRRERSGTQPASQAALIHRHLATDCRLWIISRKTWNRRGGDGAGVIAVVLHGWPVDANAGLDSAFHIYASICTTSTLLIHTLAPKRSRGRSDASDRIGKMRHASWRSCIFCFVGTWETGQSNRKFSGLATWLIRAKEVNTHARLQLRNIVSFSLAHRVQVHAPRCWCGNYNFIPSPALRPQRAEKRKPSFIIKHKTVFIWAPWGMCTSLEAHSHFCRCVFMLYIPGGEWRLIRSNKR